MTFYETEINRVRTLCYRNQGQVNTVIGIKSFIDKNFAGQQNLDVLSHVSYTSKFHLLRLFKRYYGLTPGQYLIHKRIEEAKNNLRRGMTVSDTCYSVGFGSPSSFSTLFKCKVGLTPIEFQKRATFTK